MSMDSNLNEPEYTDPEFDMHKPRADRFAHMVSVSAGAAARIGALEEALAQSEYHRSTAESQLSEVQWSGVLGTVYTADAGVEPSVPIVLDLTSGAVWFKREDGTGWAKRRASKSFETVWEWPPENQGPYIGFNQTWDLSETIEKAAELEASDEKIRRQLRGTDGFDNPDGSWKRESLDVILVRVMLEKDAKLSQAKTDLRDAATQLKILEKEHAALELKFNSSPTGESDKISALLQKAVDDRVVHPGAGVHDLIRAAELQILQDVEVPPDGGDPEYSIESLSKAAAILLTAIKKLGPPDVPAATPDDDDLPF